MSKYINGLLFNTSDTLGVDDNIQQVPYKTNFANQFLFMKPDEEEKKKKAGLGVPYITSFTDSMIYMDPKKPPSPPMVYGEWHPESKYDRDLRKLGDAVSSIGNFFENIGEGFSAYYDATTKVTEAALREENNTEANKELNDMFAFRTMLSRLFAGKPLNELNDNGNVYYDTLFGETDAHRRQNYAGDYSKESSTLANLLDHYIGKNALKQYYDSIKDTLTDEQKDVFAEYLNYKNYSLAHYHPEIARSILKDTVDDKLNSMLKRQDELVVSTADTKQKILDEDKDKRSDVANFTTDLLGKLEGVVKTASMLDGASSGLEKIEDTYTKFGKGASESIQYIVDLIHGSEAESYMESLTDSDIDVNAKRFDLLANGIYGNYHQPENKARIEKGLGLTSNKQKAQEFIKFQIESERYGDERATKNLVKRLQNADKIGQTWKDFAGDLVSDFVGSMVGTGAELINVASNVLNPISLPIAAVESIIGGVEDGDWTRGLTHSIDKTLTGSGIIDSAAKKVLGTDLGTWGENLRATGMWTNEGQQEAMEGKHYTDEEISSIKQIFKEGERQKYLQRARSLNLDTTELEKFNRDQLNGNFFNKYLELFKKQYPNATEEQIRREAEVLGAIKNEYLVGVDKDTIYGVGATENKWIAEYGHELDPFSASAAINAISLTGQMIAVGGESKLIGAAGSGLSRMGAAAVKTGTKVGNAAGKFLNLAGDVTKAVAPSVSAMSLDFGYARSTYNEKMRTLDQNIQSAINSFQTGEDVTDKKLYTKILEAAKSKTDKPWDSLSKEEQAVAFDEASKSVYQDMKNQAINMAGIIWLTAAIPDAALANTLNKAIYSSAKAERAIGRLKQRFGLNKTPNQTIAEAEIGLDNEVTLTPNQIKVRPYLGKRIYNTMRGGFISNYLQDVAVGAGKQYYDDYYNAYMNALYGDNGSAVYNSLLSSLSGAWKASAEAQSFYDGFLGAIGGVIMPHAVRSAKAAETNTNESLIQRLKNTRLQHDIVDLIRGKNNTVDKMNKTAVNYARMIEEEINHGTMRPLIEEAPIMQALDQQLEGIKDPIQKSITKTQQLVNTAMYMHELSNVPLYRKVSDNNGNIKRIKQENPFHTNAIEALEAKANRQLTQSDIKEAIRAFKQESLIVNDIARTQQELEQNPQNADAQARLQSLEQQREQIQQSRSDNVNSVLEDINKSGIMNNVIEAVNSNDESKINNIVDQVQSITERVTSDATEMVNIYNDVKENVKKAQSALDEGQIVVDPTLIRAYATALTEIQAFNRQLENNEKAKEQIKARLQTVNDTVSNINGNDKADILALLYQNHQNELKDYQVILDQYTNQRKTRVAKIKQDMAKIRKKQGKKSFEYLKLKAELDSIRNGKNRTELNEATVAYKDLYLNFDTLTDNELAAERKSAQKAAKILSNRDSQSAPLTISLKDLLSIDSSHAGLLMQNIVENPIEGHPLNDTVDNVNQDDLKQIQNLINTNEILKYNLKERQFSTVMGLQNSEYYTELVRQQRELQSEALYNKMYNNWYDSSITDYETFIEKYEKEINKIEQSKNSKKISLHEAVGRIRGLNTIINRSKEGRQYLMDYQRADRDVNQIAPEGLLYKFYEKTFADRSDVDVTKSTILGRKFLHYLYTRNPKLHGKKLAEVHAFIEQLNDEERAKIKANIMTDGGDLLNDVIRPLLTYLNNRIQAIKDQNEIRSKIKNTTNPYERSDQRQQKQTKQTTEEQMANRKEFIIRAVIPILESYLDLSSFKPENIKEFFLNKYIRAPFRSKYKDINVDNLQELLYNFVTNVINKLRSDPNISSKDLIEYCKEWQWSNKSDVEITDVKRQLDEQDSSKVTNKEYVIMQEFINDFLQLMDNSVLYNKDKGPQDIAGLKAANISVLIGAPANVLSHFKFKSANGFTLTPINSLPETHRQECDKYQIDKFVAERPDLIQNADQVVFIRIPVDGDFNLQDNFLIVAAIDIDNYNTGHDVITIGDGRYQPIGVVPRANETNGVGILRDLASIDVTSPFIIKDNDGPLTSHARVQVRTTDQIVETIDKIKHLQEISNRHSNNSSIAINPTGGFEVTDRGSIIFKDGQGEHIVGRVEIQDTIDMKTNSVINLSNAHKINSRAVHFTDTIKKLIDLSKDELMKIAQLNPQTLDNELSDPSYKANDYSLAKEGIALSNGVSYRIHYDQNGIPYLCLSKNTESGMFYVSKDGTLVPHTEIATQDATTKEWILNNGEELLSLPLIKNDQLESNIAQFILNLGRTTNVDGVSNGFEENGPLGHWQISNHNFTSINRNNEQKNSTALRKASEYRKQCLEEGLLMTPVTTNDVQLELEPVKSKKQRDKDIEPIENKEGQQEHLVPNEVATKAKELRESITQKNKRFKDFDRPAINIVRIRPGFPALSAALGTAIDGIFRQAVRFLIDKQYNIETNNINTAEFALPQNQGYESLFNETELEEIKDRVLGQLMCFLKARNLTLVTDEMFLPLFTSESEFDLNQDADNAFIKGTNIRRKRYWKAIDCLCLDENGNPVIIDFKTFKPQNNEKSIDSFLPQYSEQLSSYAYLANQFYEAEFEGKKCNDLYLLTFPFAKYNDNWFSQKIEQDANGKTVTFKRSSTHPLIDRNDSLSTIKFSPIQNIEEIIEKRRNEKRGVLQQDGTPITVFKEGDEVVFIQSDDATPVKVKINGFNSTDNIYNITIIDSNIATTATVDQLHQIVEVTRKMDTDEEAEQDNQNCHNSGGGKPASSGPRI